MLAFLGPGYLFMKRYLQSREEIENLLADGSLWFGVNSSPPPLPSPSEKATHGTPGIFGIPEIDFSLGEVGLPFGAVHEWFLQYFFSSPSASTSSWYPPLTIIASVVKNTHRSLQQGPQQNSSLVWVGKKCWPTAQLLGGDNSSLSKHSLFLDPLNDEQRLWTIIQALRSPAISTVIADGSGFNITATRRLQLAARDGDTLGLILRPPHEMRCLSGAMSRWEVAAVPSPTIWPRWSLKLLRYKGMQPQVSAFRSWIIEYSQEFGDEESSFRIPADVVYRSQAEETEQKIALSR